MRYTADKLGVSHPTILEWTSTPEALVEIDQVTRESLPDLDDDGHLARQLLRDQTNDADADPPLRQKAAAVLLANQSRAIEVAAKAKEADAATSQAKTAAQLKTLETEAMEYLDEVRKRQSER